MVEPQPIEDGAQIPWRTLEVHVYRLQKRIFRAASRGNVRAVHSVQRLLMKAEAARCLAVRRVTQDNRGKNTAGVDGIKAVPAARRPALVALLRHPATITPTPVRRVRIPKPGKPGECRPLGIESTKKSGGIRRLSPTRRAPAPREHVTTRYPRERALVRYPRLFSALRMSSTRLDMR